MQDYNNGGAAPRKEKTNEWSGIGIVRTRSGNDNEEIRFFPFQKTGGGVIHITVMCSEPIQGADENGQPRVKNTYIPVNVMTNKNIMPEDLKSIVPGMKVRVVGKLEAESYTSKKTGQKVTSLVVNAFVFEVLARPQQMMPLQYGQQPYYPQQGGYAPQQPAYGPGYQQQGYAPQNGYPGPQQQYPAGYQQQGYAPQNGYPGPQQQYPAGYHPQGPAPAPMQQTAPIHGQHSGASTLPYYVPPQGPAPTAPAAPANGVVDDLPV